MHDAQHQRQLGLLWAGLAFFLAVSLALGACGGGGGSDSDGNEERSTATSALSDDDEPDDEVTAEADVETIDVDQTFWHAGWKVTLGEATLTKDGASSTLTIDAEFENLGEDQAAFDSQLVLMAGGENYTEDSFEQDLPQVPGELSGNGVLAFTVDENFDFDNATLIVGNPDNNQATVPIGPNGDELVNLAPIEIPVTGSATAGAVDPQRRGRRSAGRPARRPQHRRNGQKDDDCQLQRRPSERHSHRRRRAAEPEHHLEIAGRHRRRGPQRWRQRRE